MGSSPDLVELVPGDDDHSVSQPARAARRRYRSTYPNSAGTTDLEAPVSQIDAT